MSSTYSIESYIKPTSKGKYKFRMRVPTALQPVFKKSEFIETYPAEIQDTLVNRAKSGWLTTKVWSLKQGLAALSKEAIGVLGRFVSMVIMSPPDGISNISEWAKRDGCWARLTSSADEAAAMLSTDFYKELIDIADMKEDIREAKKAQKFESGIESISKVIELGGEYWKSLAAKPNASKLLSGKEIEVLRFASQIPRKIPTERQAELLLDISSRL